MAFYTDAFIARAPMADRIRAAYKVYLENAAKRAAFKQSKRELNMLSDRELADLGIHRSHITRISYETAYGA